MLAFLLVVYLSINNIKNKYNMLIRKIRNIVIIIKKLPIFFKYWFKVNKDVLEKSIYNLWNGSLDYNFNYWNIFEEVHEKAEPVFILSTWRSWTALLTVLLNSIKSIDAIHAPNEMLLYYSKLSFEKNKLLYDNLKYAIDAVSYEYIKKAFIQKKIHIDSSTRSTFFCNQLYELYPKSKFIHLVRHPWDFIRSWIRRLWYTWKVYKEEWILIPPKEIININEKIAWLWYETNNFIEIFKDIIDKKRILTIMSEDLFMNSNTTKSILKFIGKDNELTDKKIMQIISKPLNYQKLWDYPEYENWTTEQRNILIPYKKLVNKYWYKI